MDFRLWGGPERLKTLVILGAGASHGANLPPKNFGPRPPLDFGFFAELQKLGVSKATSSLLEFVRSEYGSGLMLSMEEFFSQAEYTNRFHVELNVDPGRRIRKYEQALKHFYEVLPSLFRAAIGQSNCSLHRNLVERLFVEDVILSFNYDCLIDAALRDKANRKWDPDKHGYGFEIGSGASHWRNHHDKGRPFKSSVTLLKPHGSLNWNIASTGRVTLDQDPYSCQTSEGRIIPPTWFKRLQEEPFASVWKLSRLEIRACRALVVIGYSVPATDLFSRALFKAEAGSKEKRQKLQYLVLVNPDRVARARFADMVKGGLEPGTRILEFDTFKEFDLSLRKPSTSQTSTSSSKKGGIQP